MTCRALAWSLPVLWSACAAPPFPALALDGVTRQAGAEVADTELFDVLRVGPPVCSRDAAGRLTVTLEVASLDEEPLDVVATVRFVDGRGGSRGRSARCRLRLLPQQVAQCSAVATDAAAEACVCGFDWDR